MSRCLRFTASIQENMSDVLVRLSACGGGSACLEASQALVEWQARSGVSDPLRSSLLSRLIFTSVLCI
jgi:hypothetical protein